MADPESAIITGVLVTVGVTELARIVKGEGPTMGPVIAGFLMGFCLFAVALASGEIASLLAVLIALSAVILSGLPVFRALTPHH